MRLKKKLINLVCDFISGNSDIIQINEEDFDLLNTGMCFLQKDQFNNIFYKLIETFAAEALSEIYNDQAIGMCLEFNLKLLANSQLTKGHFFELIVCFELMKSFNFKPLSELPFIKNSFTNIDKCLWLNEFTLDIQNIVICNNKNDFITACSNKKYKNKLIKANNEARPDLIYIKKINGKWYALVIAVRIYNSESPIPYNDKKKGIMLIVLLQLTLKIFSLINMIQI